MKKENLSKIEVEILEDLDAFNRGNIGLSLEGFCAVSDAAKELSTGAEVEKVVNGLRRRGLIEVIGPKKLLIVSVKATQLIMRHKVKHMKFKDGSVKNGDGEVCVPNEPCSHCVVAQEHTKKAFEKLLKA